MVATGRKLTAAVEEYLAELRKIRASGAAPPSCPITSRWATC